MWTNSKVKKMIKWQCSLWCEIFCTSPLFRAGTGAQTTKQKNWFRSSRNWFGNPAWNTRAMGRSLLTLRGYLEEGGRVIVTGQIVGLLSLRGYPEVSFLQKTSSGGPPYPQGLPHTKPQLSPPKFTSQKHLRGYLSGSPLSQGLPRGFSC
jgi:hypothetical protein